MPGSLPYLILWQLALRMSKYVVNVRSTPFELNFKATQRMRLMQVQIKSSLNIYADWPVLGKSSLLSTNYTIVVLCVFH